MECDLQSWLLNEKNGTKGTRLETIPFVPFTVGAVAVPCGAVGGFLHGVQLPARPLLAEGHRCWQLRVLKTPNGVRAPWVRPPASPPNFKDQNPKRLILNTLGLAALNTFRAFNTLFKILLSREFFS